MTKCIVLATLCILFTGCTVFSPHNKLFPFLEKPIPEENINEVISVVGPVNVYSKCITLGVNPFLAVLGSPLLGCAGVPHKPDENGIYNCSIYLAYDWDWTREHEQRHCRGYAD